MKQKRKKFFKHFICICFVFAVFISNISFAEIYKPIYVEKTTGEYSINKNGITLDLGNANNGYIVININNNNKYKLRITGDMKYTYDIENDGSDNIYPLQDGSREYKITIYKQVSGSKYSTAMTKSISVKLSNELAAFLAPNRYSNYTKNSEAVKISQELCEALKVDADITGVINKYVTKNILYDYIKALTVKSGYAPDLDTILETKVGICFDFAGLMCAMLRSQGIPTKLVMGNADTTYHSWNMVLIDGEWKRFDTTSVVTVANIKNYTEEASY